MLSVNFGINKLEILSLGIYLDLISTFAPYGSKLLQPGTLLKVTHCGCFSRFPRCTNGTKLRKASHIFSMGLQSWIAESYQRFIKRISGNKSWKGEREVSKNEIVLLKKMYRLR